MIPRLDSLQRLRGIAALLVVLVHGFDLVDRVPEWRSSIAPYWLINDFGASGVDLFFVLSGFVMTLGLEREGGPDRWRAFLVARALRILPLFWVMNIVMVILLQASPGWQSVANAASVLPVADAGAFDFPPLWVGWTLAFEFGFYLMVALAMGRSRPVLALLIMVGAASLTGLVLRPALPILQVLFNPILIEFGFGVLACLAWRRGVPAGVRLASLAIGLTLLFAFRAAWPELIFSPEGARVLDGSLSLSRALLWGLPWALVLLSVVAGDEGKDKGAGPLLAIGNASYSLYLAHAILAALADKWELARSVSPPATVALIMFGSVAAGLAVHRWVERPVARSLKRLRFGALRKDSEAALVDLGKPALDTDDRRLGAV